MSDAAQLVLFAPYCSGLSREQDLYAALQILGRGALLGAASGGRKRWTPLRTPLEWGRCTDGEAGLSASFPGHPEGDFDFAVTTHQLVVWLMDCSHLQPSEPDLPNGFWQWLLIERGDAPEQA